MIRGLRLPHREQALDLEALERTETVRGAQPAAHLAEQVVAERVTGVAQPGVALEVAAPEPGTDEAADGDHPRATLDAGVLGGHPGPGMAAPDQLVGEVGVVGRRVLAAADVEPLDHHGAAERRRVGGTPDHDTGDVARGGIRTQLEPAVGGEPVRAEGRGGPGGDVLALDVAGGGEVRARAGGQQRRPALGERDELGTRPASQERPPLLIVSSTTEFSRAPIGHPA